MEPCPSIALQEDRSCSMMVECLVSLQVATHHDVARGLANLPKLFGVS